MLRSERSLWVWLLPVLLLVMALGARSLNEDMLWLDEYYSVANIGGIDKIPYGPAQIIDSLSAKSAIHTPGYFFLLSGWVALTGWTPFAMRALSLLAGVLAVACTYQAGRVWFSPWAGLFAAVILGINVTFIHYAHELRMYSMTAMFSALMLWMYGCVLRPGPVRPAYWVGLLVGMTGLIYTHTYGVLMVAALGLYHLLFVPKTRQWLGIAGLFVLTGLLLLPWTAVLLQGTLRVTASGDGSRDTSEFLNAGEVLQLAFHYFSQGNLLLLAVLGGLALVGLRIYRKRALALWFVTVTSFVLLAIMNIIIPFIKDGRIRYLLFLWPPLALLAALGLMTLWRYRSSRLAVSLLALWLALGSITGFANRDFLRHVGSWKYIHEGTPLIEQQDALAQVIYRDDLMVGVAENDYIYRFTKFYIPAEFYYHGLPFDRELFSLIDDQSANQKRLQENLEGQPRVWLVSEATTAEDTLAPYRETLAEQYVLCETPDAVPGLYIERYDLADYGCLTREPPQTQLVRFEGGITLHDITPYPASAEVMTLAMAWSVADSVPPETYSVSLKVWDGGIFENQVAQTDFGLRYPGFGWQMAELPVGDLEEGEYLMTVTVYNWRTGAGLPGSDGQGDTLPVATLHIGDSITLAKHETVS